MPKLKVQRVSRYELQILILWHLDFISGKPRRACPVLTGWPGSFTFEIILRG
jgi:hypothetical protein